MTRFSWGVLVFAACAVPRVAVLLRTPAPTPNYYWDIASNLLASGTYRFSSGVTTTAIEPVYPFFLAGARLVTGDRFALAMLLQVLAASAGGALLFLLAARVSGSQRAALAAAALYAFYPYYVRQSIAPLELTLSVVLLVAAALAYFILVQSPRGQSENIKHPIVLGGCLGLLLLLRFAFAPIAGSAVALLLFQRRFRAGGVAALVIGLLLAPWLLRTHAIDGSIVPPRGGVNLFIASCEYAEQLLPWYDADLMFGYALEVVDAERMTANVPPRMAHRVLNDALMERAVACIRADPLRAARLKLRNLLYVFSPLLLPAHARVEEAAAHVEDGQLRLANIYPRPRFHVITHATAHTVVLAGAVLGFFLRRRVLQNDAFLLTIVASIAVVYAIFFPTTRLTSPMAVVLMIYAGVGFTNSGLFGSPKRAALRAAKNRDA